MAIHPMQPKHGHDSKRGTGCSPEQWSISLCAALLYMSLHAASRASNHAHRLRFIQAVDTAQEDK
jgi:hypothetical protein